MTFFFYATDIFWTVIEWNNIFFILFLICCKIKEKKTLDTKEFLQKQETKILERYNLIKGSKLWYQMMRTSWSKWSRNPHAKTPNDTVQPCDTNQARSDSDFGVKVSSVQFYAIEHNFKSNRWIELKLYQKIPEVFVYVGIHF